MTLHFGRLFVTDDLMTSFDKSIKYFEMYFSRYDYYCTWRPYRPTTPSGWLIGGQTPTGYSFPPWHQEAETRSATEVPDLGPDSGSGGSDQIPDAKDMTSDAAASSSSSHPCYTWQTPGPRPFRSRCFI